MATWFYYCKLQANRNTPYPRLPVQFNRIMDMEETLQLYQLTLRLATHVKSSVIGQFTLSKKVQEIVLANSSSLEVYRPDPESGKLLKLSLQEVWGAIQKVSIFRLPGSSLDLLVVTSDSGKLTLMKYDTTCNQFVAVVQEPYVKTGFRRTYPGEYLAIDPQNRAIMISAVERSHLCYRVVQSEDASVSVAPPLEVTLKGVVTLDMVAMDTGFENPKFAALECTETGTQLTYYEFDQALNYIVKKKGGQMPDAAHMLIPLPQSAGGLLVAIEGGLVYVSDQVSEHTMPLAAKSGKATHVISYVTHKMKQNAYFVLVQTTHGDVFKLTFVTKETSEQDDDTEYELNTPQVQEINMTYFDTIPLCHSLNVLKSGFLFANTANGNKLYYQFENLGNDVDESTIKWTPNGIEGNGTFTVREGKSLENLNMVDELTSLNPIIDSVVIEETKQIVSASGSGHLKTITHGLPVNILVASPLPMKATDIFTTKLSKASQNDEYLVITSVPSSQTIVLSIGEVVEEVEDSQFVKTQLTIAVQQVGDSSLVQVHPNGIRYINTVTKKTTDWYPPAGITVLQASCNNQQVILGLLNREVCYFEVDPTDNQLIEYQDKLEMNGGVITSVCLSKTGKSSYGVIGCADSTITVISLEPHNCLGIETLQALSSNCSSMIMIGSELHIGLDNGLYVRTQINQRNGDLSDTKTRYVGSKPINLNTVGLPDSSSVQNDDNTALIPGILAISSQAWVGYTYQQKFKLSPLVGSNIKSGASFFSEDIGGEGIVGINQDDELEIFTLGDGESFVNLHEDFTTSSLKVRYTPKRLVYKDSPKSKGNVYIIGSQRTPTYIKATELEDGKEVPHSADDFVFESGVSVGWSSCIQVANVTNQEILQTIEFPKNERAISLAIVDFEKDPNNDYLVIGTSSSSSHFLYTFKRRGTSLIFVYKTELDFPANAMMSFQGKLLIAMANYLRLYDLGQKQLLRKASSIIDHLRNIVKLTFLDDDRIAIGDLQSSIVFVKYDTVDNKFVTFADDVSKRHITSMTKLDRNTVVGSDKFGNMFVNRISEAISSRVDEDWSILKFQEPFLNGAQDRSRNVCDYHLGDVVTSFNLGSLNIGGIESIIYTGLQGSVGILMPLGTVQEINFFNKLQLLLRDHFDYNFDDLEYKGNNLVGRDHLKWRSYYNPVKNVIDGDLIERFATIPPKAKVKMSSKLDRTPADIERKIADLRNRSAF